MTNTILTDGWRREKFFRYLMFIERSVLDELKPLGVVSAHRTFVVVALITPIVLLEARVSWLAHKKTLETPLTDAIHELAVFEHSCSMEVDAASRGGGSQQTSHWIRKYSMARAYMR